MYPSASAAPDADSSLYAAHRKDLTITWRGWDEDRMELMVGVGEAMLAMPKPGGIPGEPHVELEKPGGTKGCPCAAPAGGPQGFCPMGNPASMKGLVGNPPRGPGG